MSNKTSTITRYGQYVVTSEQVINTDEIAQLFRKTDTCIGIILKGNSIPVDNHFPDVQSADIVWDFLIDTLKVYAR